MYKYTVMGMTPLCDEKCWSRQPKWNGLYFIDFRVNIDSDRHQKALFLKLVKKKKTRRKKNA